MASLTKKIQIGKAVIDELKGRKGVGNELESYDCEVIEEIEVAIGVAALKAMAIPEDSDNEEAHARELKHADEALRAAGFVPTAWWRAEDETSVEDHHARPPFFLVLTNEDEARCDTAALERRFPPKKGNA